MTGSRGILEVKVCFLCDLMILHTSCRVHVEFGATILRENNISAQGIMYYAPLAKGKEKYWK